MSDGAFWTLVLLALVLAVAAVVAMGFLVRDGGER